MKLEDYLAAEGIKEMSIDEANKVTKEALTAKEYEELEHCRFLLYTNGPNPILQKMHTLLIEHNLAYVLRCVEFQNTRKEIPMVLENLPVNARVLDVGYYDGLKTVTTN